MSNIIKKNIDKKVRQSNHFVESPYAQEFTATELKILEIAVADCKISDKVLVEKENNKKFEFSTKELAKLLNTSVSSLSHEAERLSKSIIKKYIHGRRELPNGDIEFETIAIIPYTKYEGGLFSFELNHKLLPYFIEINGSFTEYSLKYLMNLKSAYGIKLYKLLFQYRKIGHRKFDIEELRKQFGIDIKKYKLYSDFKRRILDFSVNQINQFTDLNVNYNEVKIRNKISEIEFKFEIKNGLLENTSNTNNREELDDRLMHTLNSIEKKISEKTKIIIIDFFNNKGSLYVEASVKYALENSKTNFDKYLQDTLKNEWANVKISELKSLNNKKAKIEEFEKKIQLKNIEASKLTAKETTSKFNKLNVDERANIMAELVSKISKCCPERLTEILKEQEEFVITYWASKNNLVYKGNLHLRLNSFLKSI